MSQMDSSKLVLVTGVGRAEGLGYAVAHQMGGRGFEVLLTARDADKAEALAELLREAGHTVRALALDVASPASVDAVARLVERDYGRLDVLINNASGFAAFGEQAATADLNMAHQVFETTLFGTWRMCQAFLPLVRKSASGRIVNVSSGAGSHADPEFGLTTANSMGTSYAAAKAAVNALTVKLAREEQSGVLINAVCPGFTATFPGGEAMGARPVQDGAASIVWAALLPDGGPTGGFFRDGKPLPW